MGAMDRFIGQKQLSESEQIKQRALEILHEEARTPGISSWQKQDAQKSAPVDSSPVEQRKYSLGDKDLVYSSNSWLSNPLTLGSGAVLAASYLAPRSVARFGAGGAATFLGVKSAFTDARELLDSDSTAGKLKFMGALAADTSLAAGGIALLARSGPKWLAPGLVLGGMVARMGVDAIPDKIEQKVDHNRESKPIEAKSVTKEFAEKIERAYMRDIPEHIRTRMEAAGYKIRLAPYMTHPDARPELAGVRPRGWPEGTSWDQADGAHAGSLKQILVCENIIVNGTRVPSRRVEGVMRHEYGHAVNRVYGARGQRFSDSAEFEAAYARDVIGMTAADKVKVQYLLQPGEAGRDECFAEVFALLTGGPCNGDDANVAKFSNVRELIKTRIINK